jgi:3-hydroxyacyl-CoA dehydrogenase/3-hydroxy-2-methylbutyryl-CoA dehydrogenase
MLRNVVAIVSGGASGLGAATASYLVRHGARVIVVDLPNTHDRFLKLKNEMTTVMHNDDNNLGSLEFAPANVTIEDEISSALDKAAELFGEQGRGYDLFLPFGQLIPLLP